MERLETPCASLTLDAFSALAERYTRPLHAFLCSLVRDPEVARDLLQDTVSAAWISAQRGTPPMVAGADDVSMRRWLYRVAYRRAVDALRRRTAIRWESLDERADGAEAEPAVPVAFEELIAETDAMRQALALLDPADVSSLLLTIVQGFTAAEAAQVIGASPQAVAKRVSRAKRRLLAAYQAQNATHSEVRR